MLLAATLLAATLLALVVFSGVALAVTKSCVADVACFGTRKADTLNGSEGNDKMYGKGRGDTLNGFGGSDSLYGEGGADKLFGGMGPGVVNSLVGGPGNDLLSGGDGLEHYYFGDGWGKDFITDGATSQNAVIFSKEPAPDEFVPTTANLTIKLVSGEGPEVKNASGTSTIDWQGVAIIEDVFSGSGDDRITGNFEPNHISAGAGADNISSAGGNDLIYVADGSGDDVVDCGETLGNSLDNDTVFFDSGDQIAADCESQNPF